MTSSSTSLRDPAPSPFTVWARTAVVAVWVVIVTFILGVVVIVISFFNDTGKPVHWIARVWGRSILAVSGIRVSVTGVERIAVDQPYIFMANHQSNLDIPVLLGHLPVQFRWLAKAELFKIPVGQAMRGRLHRVTRRPTSGWKTCAWQPRKSKRIFDPDLSEGTRLDGSLKPSRKGVLDGYR
jgi:hypothetical protein